MDTTKLKRHPFNQALINTDGVSYKQFVHETNRNREMSSALSEVNTLRRDVDDIKIMLQTIINGMNKNG